MASILICNLTRFGDLLQTQPLLNGLSAQGHSASLVCLDAFSAATGLLRNLDKTFALPMAPITAMTHWQRQAAKVMEVAAEIRNTTNPDWIISLTPSPVARLLTRLLAAPKTRLLGFGMDENGYGYNQGTWASFLAMAARDRQFSPFNLADILRKIGGKLASANPGFNLAKPGEKELAWAQAFTQGSLPANAKGFICFQPGASAENRRWPIRHFQKLGKILWEKVGLAPILLGSSAEKHLAEKYGHDADHPWISAMGQTSLPQLAALLSRAPLLVTNDTGTMHLAAGLGTPSLAFFLATAQPWDTGPALHGCCCLEPALSCHPCGFDALCQRNNACREQISPETAAALILGWLQQGAWQAGVTESARQQARIWETVVDENGLMNLRSLSGHDQEKRIAWFITLRTFWSQLLDEMDGAAARKDEKEAGAPMPQAIPALTNAAEITSLLMGTGKLLGKNPKAGELFLQNCAKLEATLDSCPQLAPIAAFWREFQLNQGADINFFLSSLPLFRKEFLWLARKAG